MQSITMKSSEKTTASATEDSSKVQGNNTKAQRIIRLALWILFFLAAILPFICLYSTQDISIFAHEFVAWRIGDAISIAGGEQEFVIPVQGIFTATVSKWVFAFINDISRTALQLYSWAFAYVMFFLTGLALALASWLLPIGMMTRVLVLSGQRIHPRTFSFTYRP